MGHCGGGTTYVNRLPGCNTSIFIEQDLLSVEQGDFWCYFVKRASHTVNEHRALLITTR